MFNLLIVDDEPLMRGHLKTLLPSLHPQFQVIGEAMEGEQALKFLQNHTVDAIFTDIRMPNMDGLSLAKEIHDRYPHIPLVILSGYGEFEYARKAIRYQVHHYLLKPLDEKEVCDTLDQLYDKLLLIHQRKLQNLKPDLQLYCQAVIGHQPTKVKYYWDKLNATSLFQYQSYKLYCYELSLEGLCQYKIDYEELIAYLLSLPGILMKQDPSLILLYDNYGHLLLLSINEDSNSISLPKVNTLGEAPLSLIKKVKLNNLTEFESVYNKLIEPVESFISTIKVAYKSLITCNKDAMGMISELFSWSLMTGLFAQLYHHGAENLLRQFYQRLLGYENSYPESLSAVILPLVNPSPMNTPTSHELIIREAKEFIHEHYQEPISLTDISSYLGLSDSYLSHLFSTESDTTYIKYLTKVRMEKASALLLSDEHLSTKIIAERVGYVSPKHFSSTFKKYFHHTPSNYRNLQRGC